MSTPTTAQPTTTAGTLRAFYRELSIDLPDTVVHELMMIFAREVAASDGSITVEHAQEGGWVTTTPVGAE